jgi:DMSO/TMAO reductase YedYZ molybdopterin-dependent catalytic subunit
MTAREHVEIRAVLDVSAMLSYASGHVHVGEILIDIAEEDGVYAGLPAVALLSAHARVLADAAARARLGVLAALPGVRVLPLDAGDAPEVSLAVPVAGGDLARAHALWAALVHRAYYLTTQPQTAVGILTDDQIHPIPDHDA